MDKADPLAGLIAQSKKEGGLVFYGNPPTANFNALADKFKAAYPWISVTSYDLDDNTIFSKYASEAAQGVRTADLLIASAPNLWVPHLTLATRVAKPLLREVQQSIEQDYQPVRGTIDALAVILVGGRGDIAYLPLVG